MADPAEESKVAGAAAVDELNELNPEQQDGSLDNAGAVGGKEENVVNENDCDIEMRRQETVGFSAESDEMSFNDWR